MLDDMHGAEFIERTIAERIGKKVEVGDHVGARARVAVESDGTGIFVDSTTDVKDALGHSLRV